MQQVTFDVRHMPCTVVKSKQVWCLCDKLQQKHTNCCKHQSIQTLLLERHHSRRGDVILVLLLAFVSQVYLAIKFFRRAAAADGAVGTSGGRRQQVGVVDAVVVVFYTPGPTTVHEQALNASSTTVV